MDHFTLKESMMVGHGQIDAAHIELIDLVNQCVDLLEASATASELQVMLVKLRQTLAHHVAEEELIMNDLGYASLHDERDEHHIGLEKLNAFIEQCQNGADLEMLLRDITGLLLNLFIKSDMGFKSYLQSINYWEVTPDVMEDR